MQITKKRTQFPLEIIIEEDGLNSAIATLTNAVEGVITGKTYEYADTHPDDSYGYEDTEEYKNLYLAEQVLDIIMQAFDIDESKATRGVREALLVELREKINKLTVTG